MEVQDRCRGVMVGLAVGNLIGLPCEGWRQEEIRRRWPDGIREIEAEPGHPDDDDLARRFWVWGEENGLGMGSATRAALTHFGGSRPRCDGYQSRYVRLRGLALSRLQAAREPVGLPALEASRAAWEASGRNAAGNGAVAGAVLGARFGLGAVPERWRHRVAELRASREAMEAWADRLMA